MFRAWLRALIGWEDIESLAENNATLLGALNRQLDSLAVEVEALKYMRSQREAKAQSRPITDWERIQADFAANPENFKEN